jgi:hypothetical protein
MLHLMAQAWQEDDGVLSFEWVLLTTLLTIGVIGGLAAARDAIIDELGDVAQAMLGIDGSYTIAYPLQVTYVDNQRAQPTVTGSPVVGQASDSSFIDIAVFSDCSRSSSPAGQNAQADPSGS